MAGLGEFFGALTGIWLLAKLLRWMFKVTATIGVVACGVGAGAVYLIAGSAIGARSAPSAWLYVLATAFYIPFAVSIHAQKAREPREPPAAADQKAKLDDDDQEESPE